MKLKTADPQIAKLIALENKRQNEGLEMIPSENYTSPAIREAMGSILTNKYSEGYPHKRYYGGNEYIDDIELIAIERAKKLFQVPHANIQPYSGSPANLAVYLATCKPGDKIMGLNLPDGGHLTHGWKVSATAIFYKSIPYHVTAEGKVDLDEVWKLVKVHKPKLIWTGATAYPFQYEFDKFAEIAHSCKAYFAADIAHVAGLIIAGVHTNPVPYAHIITTTTHKTLRGPRGGMIMVTQKGLEKDPELAEKIDRAVFPGLQGGPHDHQTAAIAVALKEAATPQFKQYAVQIVKNASALASELKKLGFTLVGNGTQNHLILLDLVEKLGPGGGIFVSEALGLAGITVNKNTIPKDPGSPFFPSGIRLGTPAITTRGMKQAEMKQIALFIDQAIAQAQEFRLPQNKAERGQYLRQMRLKLSRNRVLKTIQKQVKTLCSKFPLP